MCESYYEHYGCYNFLDVHYVHGFNDSAIRETRTQRATFSFNIHLPIANGYILNFQSEVLSISVAERPYEYIVEPSISYTCFQFPVLSVHSCYRLRRIDTNIGQEKLFFYSLLFWIDLFNISACGSFSVPMLPKKSDDARNARFQ